MVISESAISRNRRTRSTVMALTLIAKDPDSQPSGSPTLYRTDRRSWVVQGREITDPEVLAQMDIPRGETACEIPDRLVPFFFIQQEE
jgi:hypothetical protein